MNFTKTIKRWSTIAVVGCLLASCLPGMSAVADNKPEGVAPPATEETITVAAYGYNEYEQTFGKKKELTKTITLEAADAVTSVGIRRETVDGKEALIFDAEGEWAQWTVDLNKAGLYRLKLLYRAQAGRNSEIGYAVAINGEIPFEEAGNLLISRIWQDDLAADAPFATDSIGNDVAPTKTEVFRWREEALRDREGREEQPYLFLFDKGENALRLTGVQDTAAIAQVILYCEEELPTYEDYAADMDTADIDAPIGHIEKVQAERATEYSTTVLSAGYDRSSVATEPASAAVIRRNTLGGSNWSYAGQWATWNITVPQDGYYTITLKYRQNFVRGLYTTRRIYIDGEVPFAELSQVKFLYSGSWESLTLGDGDTPYYIYLEAGDHTVTAEAVPGDMTGTLETLERVWEDLTTLYQKIVMITGASPDIYTDYSLDTDIPDLMATLMASTRTLRDELAVLESALGKGGSEADVLESLANQMDDFVANHYTVAPRLSEFRENISALASWIQKRREQPLELDYIAVCSADQIPPKAGGNWFKELVYQFQLFFYSFVMDYNDVGDASASGEEIEVWVGSGRDQMYILRSLIDEEFSGLDNAPSVTLKLVSASILPQAIMAGIGPDVALDAARALPVDMALRGVLHPLEAFDTFSEVTQRYMPTALEPYTMEGSVYALPQTSVHNMLFYRTDVMAELGLAMPETWEDIYQMISLLQRKNMEIGLPGDNSLYFMLLMQNGGDLYEEDATATRLDEDVAIETFIEWCEIYTQYNFAYVKSDFDRFRAGEMPFTIVPYTFYCQLKLAAPEIEGKWGMTLIPGTRQADGSIDRTQNAVNSTAVVMLESSDAPQAAWMFMDWFTSTPIQSRYGQAIEATLGTASRYTPANVEALSALNWKTDEVELLLEQWGWVNDIPEVPGAYYIARNLNNAFRGAVFTGNVPRDSLRQWNDEINREITRKRKDYDLPVAGE